MFGILKKLIKPRFAVVIGAVVLAWQGWLWLNPPAPPLDSARQALADDAAVEVVEQIASLPKRGAIVVLPFACDDTGYVTDAIRKTVHAGGEFTQPEETILQRLGKELNLQPSAVIGTEEALAAAKRLKCDYVLFGRIETFAARKAQNQITLKASIYAAASGKEALPVNVDILDVSLTAGGFAAGVLRFGVFLAGLLLLPLITLPIIRRILAVESNLVTLAGLLGYSLLIALLAVMLGKNWWLAILALFVSLFYNYVIFSRVENRRN